MSNNAALFLWYWILATIPVLLLAAVWYASPLGIGFQDPPEGESLKQLVFKLYFVSYFIGIPALLVAHITAGVLGFTGRRSVAYKVSLFSMLIFLLSICIITSFFS